jgi:LmbE family N-acetylglucosaminyl deacetylase
MKRILAIGSHFDDIEIGCAGTLYQHVQKGDDIYVSILNADENKTGDPTYRLAEQKRSLEKLDIDFSHLILFNGFKVYNDYEIISKLDEIRPDIIYIPWEKDSHQDHRRCFKIGQSVGRKRYISTLMYHCGSSIDFKPNLFNMIDWNKKIDILNKFETQIFHGAINIDIIKAKERYFATLISDKEDKYAEGFIARKMRYMV